jgi:WD40 repeat protein
VRERIEPAREDGDRVVCPFKGLASFEAADAPYFFGRERLVAELVARLVGAPLLGVVGPSGSGKSSVVRAGLLPALAGGVLPGSQDWPQVLIRPGEHPVRELRAAIDEVGARRFVLGVDQFEETFTVCRDETERTRFISELVRASRPEVGAVVVVALRADFYGRCAAYPALSRLLAANHVLVGAMRHAELQRTIVGPAQRVGLHVEPELVDVLVKDIEDEPGALPLLSTALLELWQRRDGRRLRLASYEATGGVLKAVARLAEDGFGRLDTAQQALARTVLLRLAEVEPEGGVERRRLPLEELEAGRPDVANVIGLLADARLLTVSAGTVEFAHEALLREWPRLAAWIEDDRDDLRVHRSLSAGAREWQRLGRDEGALFRGAQLEEARDWADRGDPGPTQAERDFLDASLDRERRDQRMRRRNLSIAFGALALGLLIVAAIAIVAVNERRDAVDQRNIASSRALALQSANTLDADPALALTLALRAVDASPTDQAVAALRQGTLAVRELAVLPADSRTARTAAYSSDGGRVVAGGDDGIVRVWDVATRREVARLAAGHGPVLAARYAPGDQRIALGFEDGTLAVAEGSLDMPRTALQARKAAVQSVAYSGDGERIAAAFADGTVRVLAADGSGSELTLTGHRGPVLGVDINADGSRVVSAGEDGSVRLWNGIDGGLERILHTGATPEADVQFSPDGSRILGVGSDHEVRLWNAKSGAQETQLHGGARELSAAAFSPDGRRFAVGGDDGVVRVWSATGGPPVAELRGQGSRVYDVGFGAAGDRVVSAGDDGTARIWDAGRTQVWQAAPLTYNIDFSPDGRLISGASDDGTARIWDSATGRVMTSLPGVAGYTTARYSPTADEVVVASNTEATVRVWPVAGTAEVVARLPKRRRINAAHFDRSGGRIVYVDGKRRVVVHDLSSGRETTLGRGPKDLYDAQLSPDGTHVAAAGEKGTVVVWRIDRPDAPERVLKGHRGHINAISYAPDGRLVSGGADRTVRVWSPQGAPEAVLQGHDDEVSTVIFTPGGRRILSSSNDGTVRLWDTAGGDALAVLQSGTRELHDVTLSGDGRIATLDEDDVVRVFRCEVCGSLDELRTLARTRVTRPLTPEERQRFLTAER